MVGLNKKLVFVVTAEITASTFVLKFAKFLAAQGIQVTIMADGLSPKQEVIGKGSLTKIPVSMAREPNLIIDLKSLFSLYKQIKRVSPDIVIYATPKASLLASIASVLTRVPTRVYQIWGLRLETTSGVKRFILKVFEVLICLLSTKILANSPSLSSKYQELGLNTFRRIDVLGEGSSHGVDIVHFSRLVELPQMDPRVAKFLEERKSHLIVGFVGRFHPDKGIDTLFDAIRLVRQKTEQVSFLMIGADEGAPLDDLQSLKNEVCRIGQVPDVRPYYVAMDLLVLPSLREGFPNVVLEASAMSVPSIVSDGTGVIDSVVSGETGLVIPVGDASELAKAIEHLNQDRAQLTKFGAAARLRAERSFRQEDVWSRSMEYFLD